MEMTPFIAVDNCKEAIEYYRSVFGGETVILRTRGETVMNADLLLPGTTLKFADTEAAQPQQRGDYVRVFAKIDTEAEFRRIYSDLAAEGAIVTAAYEAPFNGLLAIVTDRNGVCWVLSFYRN
ncbi:VOC family protein [Paenibacillus athensensis]|uniref:VOC family protein n=1 Tax=Paenibacillus athensensis TaxID=1967502 RepID=A0A4Y8Q8K3_9BACL|nr:VOC family protein [Paenibacillus athensensis]MCD1260005.1 VOC family protein [Paenibacillus athensensis]